MILRRFMTLALAGMLALETPMTTLASETLPIAENGEEQEENKTAGGQENDGGGEDGSDVSDPAQGNDDVSGAGQDGDNEDAGDSADHNDGDSDMEQGAGDNTDGTEQDDSVGNQDGGGTEETPDGAGVDGDSEQESGLEQETEQNPDGTDVTAGDSEVSSADQTEDMENAEVTVTAAEETGEITLVYAAEGESATGVYDVTRTLKMQAGAEEPLAETYYVTMTCTPEGDGAGQGIDFDDNLVLTAENNYEAKVCTAAYSGMWLHPDTEYTVCWQAAAQKDAVQPDAELRETFRTGEATVEIKSVLNGRNSQNFQITLSAVDVAHMRENESGQITLYPYIRKSGETDYVKKSEAGILLSYDNNFRNKLEMRNLEEDTAYELSLRDADNVVEYSHFDFRTARDCRSLSDATAQADTTVDTLNVPMTMSVRLNGNSERDSIWVLFYYREANDAQPKKWSYITKVSSNAQSQMIRGSVLVERGKTYDYAALLSDSGMAVNPDSITREGFKVTGRFTVPKAVAIQQITLSPDRLTLNAAFPKEDGYGRRFMRVSMKPADASRLYGWGISDKSVVDMDAWGEIVAKSPGEAVVTVKAAPLEGQTETLRDECPVTVGNWQVRLLETESGQITAPQDNRITLARGKALNGRLVVVSVDADGNETVVPEEEYTIETGNSGVVTVKNGMPQAGNVGTTRVLFKQKGVTNGWKTYVAWETLAAGRQICITGMQSSNANYPALSAEGGYEIVCAADTGYTAECAVSSGEAFDPSLFTWKTEDAQIATVDDAGVVKGIAPGKTILTVEPKNGDDGAWAMKEPLRVPIIVTQMPEVRTDRTYNCFAVTNLHKKLRDVKCPLEGWEWESPDTPLSVNGVVTSENKFYMICRQEGYYPRRWPVYFWLGQVTGMTVVDEDHDGVVQVSGAGEEGGDVMSLKMQAVYYGSYNHRLDTTSRYMSVWNMPDVPGLAIDLGKSVENDGSDHYDFKVRALKPGTYTLRPTLTVQDKESNAKVVYKTTYKITAVADPVAKSVVLEPDLKADGGLAADRNNRIVMDAELLGKTEGAVTFPVGAVVKDKDGNELDTKLVWKSSDKKVAALAVSKDTHTAEVTLKGEGHATLTATVKDALGVSAQLRIEIQNHAPRVNISQVRVNTAFDYAQAEGRELAGAYSGVLEILPAYAGEIKSVRLYEKDASDHGKNGISLYDLGGNEWLVCPDTGIAKGKQKRTLLVETAAGKTYEYPLTVTVEEKKPKVTVKQTETVNLFYRGGKVEFQLNAPVEYKKIKEARWESQAGDSRQGFASESGGIKISMGTGKIFIDFAQKNIDLDKRHKPVEPKAFKGNIIVTLKGYREPVTVGAAIKYTYKKPVVVTQAASSYASPAADMPGGEIQFYNKTDGRILYWSAGAERPTYYDAAVCDNDGVEASLVHGSSHKVEYRYKRSARAGKKTSEKLTFTLDSGYWREPLKAVHTVKLGVPKAYLTVPKIVFNTNRLGGVSTEVLLKEAEADAIVFDDIEVTGKNAKAKKLLEEELLRVTVQKNKITVSPTKETKTEQGKGTVSLLPAGTYNYKVVPYYTDMNGERKAANALTLNVKVVNKAVKAKVKTKGSLDLTRVHNTGNLQAMNCIDISTAFSNIGNGYRIKKMELAGSYSQRFTFVWKNKTPEGSLNINGYGGNLRSGVNYKLYMRYTVEMEDGSVYQVTSDPFYVKLKHSAPKVKIIGNNQILYTSAENVSRTYQLETPQYKSTKDNCYYYNHYIESASGSLDCNKDGIPDIEVKGIVTGWSYKCDLKVSIKDRDGVLAVTGKSKTYTIPVTVKLKGRDGIGKDVKTSIKVTVRR